jgi:hypothetical protein
MNRLFEIASELGEIARKRFLIRDEIRSFEINIKAEETAMIPEGGWPGSNDMQRKAAEATAKANSPSLIYSRTIMQEDQTRLDSLEVDREVLIAERDAWMWTIRDREQTAFNGDGMSVFRMMEQYSKDKVYQATVDEIRAQMSLDDLDERQRDDAAAAMRIAEMNNLGEACQWELGEIQLPASAKTARIRHQELMELQDAYEAKYHL